MRDIAQAIQAGLEEQKARDTERAKDEMAMVYAWSQVLGTRPWYDRKAIVAALNALPPRVTP